MKVNSEDNFPYRFMWKFLISLLKPSGQSNESHPQSSLRDFYWCGVNDDRLQQKNLRGREHPDKAQEI
jgi:hypothetical protein